MKESTEITIPVHLPKLGDASADVKHSLTNESRARYALCITSERGMTMILITKNLSGKMQAQPAHVNLEGNSVRP